MCVMCLSWLSCCVCFVDVDAAPESERDENMQSTGSSVTDDKKQQSPFTPCSPHDIRPLPKAGPRSGKAPSRKRGRTRILTDTPEKLLIEKEAAARDLVKCYITAKCSQITDIRTVTTYKKDKHEQYHAIQFFCQ